LPPHPKKVICTPVRTLEVKAKAEAGTLEAEFGTHKAEARTYDPWITVNMHCSFQIEIQKIIMIQSLDT
jgi:hypothetical protein